MSADYYVLKNTTAGSLIQGQFFTGDGWSKSSAQGAKYGSVQPAYAELLAVVTELAETPRSDGGPIAAVAIPMWFRSHSSV